MAYEKPGNSTTTASARFPVAAPRSTGAGGSTLQGAALPGRAGLDAPGETVNVDVALGQKPGSLHYPCVQERLVVGVCSIVAGRDDLAVGLHEGRTEPPSRSGTGAARSLAWSWRARSSDPVPRSPTGARASAGSPAGLRPCPPPDRPPPACRRGSAPAPSRWHYRRCPLGPRLPRPCRSRCRAPPAVKPASRRSVLLFSTALPETTIRPGLDRDPVGDRVSRPDSVHRGSAAAEAGDQGSRHRELGYRQLLDPRCSRSIRPGPRSSRRARSHSRRYRSCLRARSASGPRPATRWWH